MRLWQYLTWKIELCALVLLESFPYSNAFELEPSMAELLKSSNIFEVIAVSQPSEGPIPEKLFYYAVEQRSCPLFVDEKLGVLDLMSKIDRSAFMTDVDGKCEIFVSDVMRKQLERSKTLENITAYKHFLGENLIDSYGAHETSVVFPSYLEDDGMTPHAGIRIELNDSSKAPQVIVKAIAVPILEEAQVSEEFYKKRVKQPCEAASRIFEDYYDCYFQDRLRALKRVPRPKARSSVEDRLHTSCNHKSKPFPARVFPLTTFNTGLDAEELETFRPFNNIKFKNLQRAIFDPECRDVARSLKLFLPDLPWVFIEGISGDFHERREYLKKNVKDNQDQAIKMVRHRRFHIHFNQREVDLICTHTEADFQRGEVQARFALQHVKFVILDNRQTVRFIGPLPAPRGYTRISTKPKYTIEMFNDLDLDKKKADGILGITRAVVLRPLKGTRPTPLSLCVINRKKTPFHLGHGSVWCRGIKIDLILNKDDKVDLKFSCMDVDTFTNLIFLKKEYNTAILAEVHIEPERMIEVAVGVFEESFFNYNKLDKNCLSYMYTLAMRLSHYRWNRASRMDFPQQSVYSGRYTVEQRDEYQAAVNHFANVMFRMKAFQSKSKKEKVVHWVSRRGLDGDMIYLNSQ
ncbi:hypothetical protein EC991_006620 [Linnemannia zychae]|nr:hypothetical protein EC991_006620 [Linnemannia zychae]